MVRIIANVLYCIVSIHLYSASCSAHQSETLPVRGTQREESMSLEFVLIGRCQMRVAVINCLSDWGRKARVRLERVRWYAKMEKGVKNVTGKGRSGNGGNSRIWF